MKGSSLIHKVLISGHSTSAVIILGSLLVTACNFEKTVPRDGQQVAHFHHVHLNVTSPEKTRAFYEDFFGAIRLTYHKISKALFTERSFILVDSVGTKPISNQGTSMWHIGWAGVDGKSEFQSRANAGIGIQTPITAVTLPGVKDSLYYMYFTGPDNELIEISTVNQNHRFEHIHLLVSDIEITTKWFSDILGLAPESEKAVDFYGIPMNSFVVDNVNIILFSRPNSSTTVSFMPEDKLWPANGEFKITDGTVVDHIAFSYASIEPVFKKIESIGGQIVKPIETNTQHGHSSFFVRSPDKLLVEIVREKSIPEGIWQ